MQHLKHTWFFTILLLIVPFGINAQDTNPAPDFRLTGFFQQHLSNGTHNGDPLAFSIRRIRVGVQGRVQDNVSFVLVAGGLEPPDRNPQLVNAFVNVNFSPALSVRAGQFFVPFGLEGQESITRNPAIDRSLVVRRLNTHRMFRDIGVQLSGGHGMLSYTAAVINGAGANVIERIDPKDFVGRISLRPMSNFEIGLSGQLGRYLPDITADDHIARNKYGIDLNYRVSRLQVRSEIIYRYDELPSDQEQNWIGGYLLGNYKINDSLNLIGRFEYLERDTDTVLKTMRSYLFGANYAVYGNIRLSGNYEFRQDYFVPDVKDHLVTVQMLFVI